MEFWLLVVPFLSLGLQSPQQMIWSIFINAFNTSALEDPSVECLKFEEMHDGVKAQKEKCTKPPSKKVSVLHRDDYYTQTYIAQNNLAKWNKEKKTYFNGFKKVGLWTWQGQHTLLCFVTPIFLDALAFLAFKLSLSEWMIFFQIFT